MTTKEFISPGEEMTISIRFPDAQRVALPVKVIWSRQDSFVDIPEYFVGVKLLEPLTPETTQYIRFYVRYFFQSFRKNNIEP